MVFRSFNKVGNSGSLAEAGMYKQKGRADIMKEMRVATRSTRKEGLVYAFCSPPLFHNCRRWRHAENSYRRADLTFDFNFQRSNGN